MLRHPTLLVLCIGLTACPAINSKPCVEDAECAADQRCRRGACGPICLSDAECGSGQLCQAGVCAERPECATAKDCATGFSCSGGRCQCSSDAVCAANQQCAAGRCTSRPRCSADADCLSSGGRCEITQGLCLPQCTMPEDCAPSLDPRVAFAIYTCVQGSCTRRCTTDAVCGGADFICQAGLCTKAQCKTAADCPPDQYCTSATAGRCLGYQVCTTSTHCSRNFECGHFATGQCPPGFDCTKQLCLELPRCLADGDCVTANRRTGYCEEGHCQVTTTCTAPAACGTGLACIGGLCVPSVCRGHSDCGADQACVDGRCTAEPPPEAVIQLKLWPSRALLRVGEGLQFSLIELPLDGSTFPTHKAMWQVVDAQGQATTAAAISPAGVLTTSSEGELRVRATLNGAAAPQVEATVLVYPVVTQGRRVVVTTNTKTPVTGAHVLGCLSASCGTPIEVISDAHGIAVFPSLGVGPAIFTAASPALRSDGLPLLERASIVGTRAMDVLLPLRDNPVQGSGGFSASLSFTDVSTSGSYWAGFVTSSVSDVASLTPAGLVGDSFSTNIPGLNQAVPVPATVVLYTSPGFGIPQQVKPRSLGLAESGDRFMAAWAGRANPDLLASLRSTDVLSYLGAFDVAQDTNGQFSTLPWVPDATDINGNGLCSNVQKCPNGSENVPDYGHFKTMSWQPKRQQRLRTEVIVPALAATYTSLIAAAVQVDATVGMLPTGFASATPGAPGATGTRKVDPVLLRSGAAYNGVELARPGIWALASNTNGTAFTGQIQTFGALPTSVSLAPWLPAPTQGSFEVATRTFHPGQPAWSSTFSAGAQLARVALTGSEVRHVIYFAIDGGQVDVKWPLVPSVPGVDPATQAAVGLEVVVMALADLNTPEELFGFGGPTLDSMALVTARYARVDR